MSSDAAEFEADLDSWELLNVVDTRGGVPCRRTIAYNGEVRPCRAGLCHTFRYRTRGGCVYGCGIVINPEYAKMSSAEIILKATAEDPVTADDRSRFVADNGIVCRKGQK